MHPAPATPDQSGNTRVCAPAASNTGGSNGATMRFAPESDYGANAGLKGARDLLEPVKAKFPWLSYADLYTLGGVVAVEEMGGAGRPVPREGRLGCASNLSSGVCNTEGARQAVR